MNDGWGSGYESRRREVKKDPIAGNILKGKPNRAKGFESLVGGKGGEHGKEVRESHQVCMLAARSKSFFYLFNLFRS